MPTVFFIRPGTSSQPSTSVAKKFAVRTSSAGVRSIFRQNGL